MRIGLSLLISLFFFKVAAQNNHPAIQKVLAQFETRDLNNPSSTLYLHCDKTLYTNNETIWFAAYLQKNRGIPIEKNHTLSVALVHDDSKKVNVAELYVMEGGLASGSILLPDSIPPGSYHLLAYTNIVDQKGKPFEVFSQPLTIKTTLETKFNASIRLLDTAQNFKGNRRVSLRASGIPIQKNGKYPPATISYYTPGQAPISVQTNGDGEAIISVAPTGLGSSLLNAAVSYDKETKHLSLQLPVIDPKKVNIKFYPEGGELSDGLSSHIGWEALTAYGQPISLKAVLLQNGNPIDTIETSVSGMGSFKLRAMMGAHYQLKLFKSNVLAADTIYTLPEIKNNLPVIVMEKGVVSDTISFVIKSKAMRSLMVLVHDSHQVYSAFVTTANAAGRQVRIALKEVPKGIAWVMVLDTLGNPLAERLFFAHYTAEELINTATDKPVYQPREKVTLKLRLKETGNGTAQQALVSVSAVQGNRIETSNFRDMESYTYLEHEMGNLPISPNGMPYRNKDYLENLLLVKGWSRFVWDEKNLPNQLDTAGMYSSLEFSGKVTKNGKELIEPVNLTIIRDTIFGVVRTQDNGAFMLRPDQASITSLKKILFFVNEKNKVPYKINLSTSYTSINNTLKDLFASKVINSREIRSNSTENRYIGMDKQIQLNVVEVFSKEDNLITNTKKGYQPPTNLCGDWVCSDGTLNCKLQQHTPPSFNSIPVKGKLYKIASFSGGKAFISTIIYPGCIYEITPKNMFFSINGRNISKEFYVNNYKIEANAALDLQSTVYWQPFVELTAGKDTEVTFYTSDLKAPYRIVVQGIDEKQVVTGATTFKVQ